MKKLLYAMRHCETLFNAQHKSQGWCDSPITPRGVEQCKRAGEELARRGIEFDHFYSSTSERCCDTMELVCQAAFGEVKPYVRKKGLRECGFGIFEAKDDFCEPDFMDRGAVRSLIMQAGGGETDAQIFDRIGTCMSEIMADPTAQNVLVTSSGGVLRHFFMQHANDEANAQVFVNSNCMCYVYEWEDGVFTLSEVYVPDIADLDFGGLGGSGVPNRFKLDVATIKAALD